MNPTFVRVKRVWDGRFRDDALIAIEDDAVRPVAQAAGAVAGYLPLTLLPPLTDAHVHIGLSDLAERGTTRLARVLDLGWNPGSLARLTARSRLDTQVVYAGTFLTAPGGYPSDRGWAPAGSWTEITGTAQAVTAVRAQLAGGASVIKVALNAEAGPVLGDELLRAIVAAAHAVPMPVVAHVEGAGEAIRAYRCGVDAFAHAPWSERLGDADVAAMAAGMTWISTLDMHGRGRYADDYGTALDNLTRFIAHGGNVAYGTDLGNEASEADLNPREVAALRAAGLAGDGLIAAMTGGPGLPRWSTTASIVTDGYDPIAGSRPVTAAQLKEYVV